MKPEEIAAIEARATATCDCGLCSAIRSVVAALRERDKEIAQLKTLCEDKEKALQMMERGLL